MNMPIPFLDLSRISDDLKNSMKKKFAEMLDKGIFSAGEEVVLLEKNLMNYLRAAHVVACANGTDALEIALRVLGIGHGDEVIVPALTWVSTAESVMIVGAKPVFVDTDAEGLMDLDLLDSLTNPRTKAIIPVHLYGKMVDMERLMVWSRKNKLLVIEDAAQAFGSFQNGVSAGCWGDVGCFSFYPTKNLGAFGEAGALVIQESKLDEGIRLWINHGQITRDKHLALGRNSRIDSIQAGFLNIKMDCIDTWQKRRKFLSEIYLRELKGVGDLILPKNIHESNHNAHLFVIRTQNRDELKTFLSKKEIGTAIHYPLIIPLMDPYVDERSYPMAEEFSKTILSLPLNPWLLEEECMEVVDAVKAFYSGIK